MVAGIRGSFTFVNMNGLENCCYFYYCLYCGKAAVAEGSEQQKLAKLTKHSAVCCLLLNLCCNL